MQYTVVQYSGARLIGLGIEIPSGNQPEAIIGLWKKFMYMNAAQLIPSPIDANLIELFTDYHGDHTQPMMVVIGAAVSTTAHVPNEFVAKTIPSGKYAVFTAADPTCIGSVWQWIWQSDLKRTFRADFDFYSTETQEVKIFVGIE